MFTCHIISNEKEIIAVLKKYIERAKELQLTAISTNPVTARQEMRDGTAEIIFIDTDMPQLATLLFPDLIETKSKVILIKLAADEELDAGQEKSTSHLVKPFSYQQFFKVVSKTLEQLTLSAAPEIILAEEYFFINPGTRGKRIKLYSSEILYIEGLKNHVIIHTKESRYTTCLCISELMDLLPPNFRRVQKSYIVNIGRIRVVEAQLITLENNQTLPLGGLYKEAFMKDIELKTLRTMQRVKQYR